MNWLSLNYRFKCGCLVGSTPTRCFPVSTGNLKFVFWIPNINSVNWHRKRLAIPPSWTVRLRHAVLCWHTAAHCRCSANTGWKVPGGHWVLTIVSQRKKGCESLTYPFPGFNFCICLSTTYTCQDNVSRPIPDSVATCLDGQLKTDLTGAGSRQRGSMAEWLKAPVCWTGKVFKRTYAGSNPAASVARNGIAKKYDCISIAYW